MDTNDRFTNTSNGISFSHTLDIIKAAFPYLDSQTQQSLDLVIKTGELFETLNAHQQAGSVTALSVRIQSIDIEALLNGIRDVCNRQERDFIDMILNFFKAKNFYNMYTTLQAAMATQSENTQNMDNSNYTSDSNTDSSNNNTDSSNNNSNGFGNMFGMNGNSNMMDILEAFLTPEQKSTFDNINMMMNVMQSNVAE